MTILILKTEVTLDKLTFNNSHLSIKSLLNEESYYKVVDYCVFTSLMD